MIERMLITDLESTCFERGKEPVHFFSEIIEIGATLYNFKEMRREDEYQTFVKPVLFPNLSSFCTELTSITNDDVKKGITIREAFEGYKRIYQDGTTVLASWGAYDARQILRQAKKFNLSYPFSMKHINIKAAFARFYNENGKLQTKTLPNKGIGMGGALKQLNMKIEGTHHRAFDDTKNIEKIVVRMIEDGWNPLDDIIFDFRKY
ncbi:3'-5' exonuclease [Chengkuizengella axinellae]|uniref:3'-5' exonuclease n=1 Tax=Chengkuizengella axinellae TaxID=3064388 RepID=A0ABT9J1C9_9BACL|nr:3'-5' exonuclease [Chengkuizengella sp. 2205SS18-9]MDP5274814.1 3'-5' exonuclease [Chengkuizengella sp. 2205SS18-9]